MHLHPLIYENLLSYWFNAWFQSFLLLLKPIFQLSDGAEDDEELYNERRFSFGIPEGAAEMAGELPLYMNADLLNGVSGNKGCYIGQELTARALHAPQIKKRVLPFSCTG